MNFIILAGGEGTRLKQLTTAVNKHLLPAGAKPVICHSLELAEKLGASRILLITQPHNIAKFSILTKNKNIYFAGQQEPDGIAGALKYAEEFSSNQDINVILGDNIFNKEAMSNIHRSFSMFNSGATIWYYPVNNPQDYGNVVIKNGVPIKIVEKPKSVESNNAIVGLYRFDRTVWAKLKAIQKSARGEYEVVDIINQYLNEQKLYCHELRGKWYDVGHSIDAYYRMLLNVTNNGG